MSKEMTPQEALQMIQDNLTPRVLGILTVEFNVVKKALDRLEETNFNYHNALAFCEASKEEKQELYKQIKQLEKENQELKEKISKFEKPILYMCRDRRSRELERLRLLELVNTYNVPILLNDFETVKELEKIEKVIAWLKNTFEITLDSKLRISDGTDCIQAFPIDLKTNEVLYDLLKEVLESV